MQGSVLIVEDDAALRHSLASALRTLNFVVSEAGSGELALAELKVNVFDLVLLDLNMPGMGGIAACGRMRNLHPQLSIIVLSVRDTDEDKIAALGIGADDYVTKPFRLPELEARMRAAIRRTRQGKNDSSEALKIGDIFIDPGRHRVAKAGRDVHLTPKEFELLHLLMRHAGRPLTHQHLLSSVWGPACETEREYLRTYMSQLRRKLEDDPAQPRYLLTESYLGYRFLQP